MEIQTTRRKKERKKERQERKTRIIICTYENEKRYFVGWSSCSHGCRCSPEPATLDTSDSSTLTSYNIDSKNQQETEKNQKKTQTSENLYSYINHTDGGLILHTSRLVTYFMNIPMSWVVTLLMLNLPVAPSEGLDFCRQI